MTTMHPGGVSDYPATARARKTRLPPMTRCTSLAEFRASDVSTDARLTEIATFETELLGAETFNLPGYCAVCDREAAFLVDHEYCLVMPDGRRVPNWRERLICPHCGLNNRMRAAATFLLSAAGPDHSIYLTESVSPLFRCIASERRRTIGSEFLRDGTARGAMKDGVRHEDATCLTFADSTIDVIGTFDVLEHVPNYRRALSEFHRCLRPSGKLIITVPFLLGSDATTVRARIDKSGTITHLLPPEIHGDPTDAGGALCFYHFGWDILDALRGVGFADASLLLYWDPRLGHLGGYQILISACKVGEAVACEQRTKSPPLLDHLVRFWRGLGGSS